MIENKLVKNNNVYKIASKINKIYHQNAEDLCK